MRGVIVFDVNETLLDLSALGPFFARTFGDAAVLESWFQQVLHYSLVSTLAGPYFDFAKIASACLDMTAEAKGVSLSSADRDELAHGLLSLPAHPDAGSGLSKLQRHGFRLAALSNSSAASIDKQLAFAGLASFFELRFSIETGKRYKPAPEAYLEAARELGIEPRELTLVAAHAWDVAGAMQAGCRTAFVARPGRVLFPLYAKPTYVGRNLNEVADQLMSSEP